MSLEEYKLVKQAAELLRGLKGKAAQRAYWLLLQAMNFEDGADCPVDD